MDAEGHSRVALYLSTIACDDGDGCTIVETTEQVKVIERVLLDSAQDLAVVVNVYFPQCVIGTTDEVILNGSYDVGDSVEEMGEEDGEVVASVASVDEVF